MNTDYSHRNNLKSEFSNEKNKNKDLDLNSSVHIVN